MSIDDAERLLKDLQGNEDLKNTLKAAGPDSFESAAKAAGYDVTRHDFANAIKAQVVRADLAGPKGFEVADGIVSGISGGISSHVSGVGTGIA